MTNSSWVVSFKRKTKILYPDEGFFMLHPQEYLGTDRKKDKIWVQKTVLHQIIITQDEFDTKEQTLSVSSITLKGFLIFVQLITFHFSRALPVSFLATEAIWEVRHQGNPLE